MAGPLEADFENTIADWLVADVAQAKFADRLAKQIDLLGTIEVLRRGVDDLGVTIRLAYFKPAHGLNPQTAERYAANRLTVTRQLPFDPASVKTLDLCLFVTGCRSLPLS